MFIINLKNGRQIVEDRTRNPDGTPMTWDDVPKDARIANLQLTHPNVIEYRDGAGVVVKKAAPIVSIGSYDRYYFHNEAVASMQMGGKTPQLKDHRLVAKVIAGIDDKIGLVVEVRVDLYGNTDVRRFPVSQLEENIARGQFRASVIRNGAR